MPQHAKDILKKFMWLVISVPIIAFVIYGLIASAPGVDIREYVTIPYVPPQWQEIQEFVDEWYANLSWLERFRIFGFRGFSSTIP